MNAGSWPSICLIYLYGVLASASISKLIPLADVFTQSFGASPEEFAIILSLLTLPAAIIGAAVGGVVDRFGPGRALVLSAATGALANLAYLFAENIGSFEIIRLFEGCALVGIFAAAPALIMATTTDKQRVRAMALWSTYTPVGFSSGLLLSGALAGTEQWRGIFVAHGVVFATLAAAGLWLPRIEQVAAVARPTWTARARQFLSGYTDKKLLRLVLALGCIVSIGFGTSTVVPTYFAHEHHIAIGTASSMLAAANLSMILGSVLTGVLLSRGVRARNLFAGLAAAGILSGVIIYLPTTPLSAGLAFLCVWLATTGAAMATVMAVLPKVVATPQKGASAAGLISQASALVAFITPPIWLPIVASNHWPFLIALVLLGWIGSLVLLPVWSAGFSTLEAPGMSSAQRS